MKLNRLFAMATWERVRSAYLAAHPEEKPNLPGIRKAFSCLRKMQPEASGIRLTYVPEMGENGMARLRLTELDGIAGKGPVVLSLVPWWKWPGMDFDVPIPSDACAAVIVADCLFEMTRLGSSENEVLKNAILVNNTVLRMNDILLRRGSTFWSRHIRVKRPGVLWFYDEMVRDEGSPEDNT